MVNVYSEKSRDPEKRSAGDVALVIEDTKSDERTPQQLESFEEAKHAAPVTTAAERTSARLLICTTNVTALQAESELSQRLLDIATLFAEVHVVVLSKTTEGAHEPSRLADNLWAYPTNSRHTLAMIDDAARIAKEQFEFAGGFRADIVLALDAFEAGVVAAQIAKKYQRPFQVHITHDIYGRKYLKGLKNPLFKRLCRWYVFRQKPSIRVATRAIAKNILARHPGLEERVEVVPQHIDLRHITQVQATGVLTERFPQYTFFILFVGPLTDQSGALEAFSAASSMLQYPTIALLFIGEGNAKQEIQNRAEAQGVEEQVIISPRDISVVQALVESHILVYPDGVDADERVLLEAAAAGLPIVARDSDFVREVFTDGESAYICPAGDNACMQGRLNQLLNENNARLRLARNAKDDVLNRIEQDVDEYRVAFKESVERVLYAYETPPGDEVVTVEQDAGDRS